MKERPADYVEGRRLRAWDLKQAGWSQKRIAEALGVTAGAVSRWMKRAREAPGGPAAGLRRRPHPGPKPRLTEAHRAAIPELLARGAESFGCEGDFWTTKRVAAVIGREWGVRYHRNHVGKLLRALGLSVQQPVVRVVRATQRDEAVIAAWATERWPAIEKKRPPSSARSSG